MESLRDQVIGQNVLLVRAKVARDVLPDEFAMRAPVWMSSMPIRRWFRLFPAEACGRFSRPPSRLPDVVTFTSSSTVTNFFQLLREANIAAWPSAMAAASIGPITSQTLRHHGIEPAVEATEYTIPGLVEALCRWSANTEAIRESLVRAPGLVFGVAEVFQKTIRAARFPRNANFPSKMNHAMRKVDPAPCGISRIKSCSIFSGVVDLVSSSRCVIRITCVSTTTPSAILYHDRAQRWPFSAPPREWSAAPPSSAELSRQILPQRFSAPRR